MRVLNSYLLTVATLLLGTVVLLAALGQQDLGVYYSILIIEALMVTELYVYLNARARRALTGVSLLLFAGFLALVAQKVVAILT